MVTPPPSPRSSPASSMSLELLLPSSPHVQMVDLGDGGSSDSESIESNEAAKKSKEVEKAQGLSQWECSYQDVGLFLG